ncbi:GNAT family N-acetyltransferase [Pedobacter sp. SYSU D00535]|uniref:GNAT family N-acetyltransferase n=1 Tax=Pedobacter sp. SYSU D00535 TaxID=2810308 RepID=UPI001A976586|nr:GNAT family N-acetyltransferase [Pedobacter sp. SYSU D00535]
MNIEIKQVTLDNLLQLQEISRQTFSEAFAATNSEENMVKYLQESFSAEKLMTELTNENSAFYFGIIGEKVVGYLKLNSGAAQTDLKDKDALEIERIYVLQEFHGKKVAQSLYKKAIEVATRRNARFIWLGVWEKNPRAIRFYRKNGFVEFDQHIFKLGEDEQTDILMKLELTPPAG